MSTSQERINWNEIVYSGASTVTPRPVDITSGSGYSARETIFRSLAGQSNPHQEEVDMAPADTPTREEIYARMEAVEERLNGKLISIDGKMDRMVDAQARLSDDLRSMRTDFDEKVGEVRDDIKSYKSFIIGGGLTLAGLIIGFFAFGVQMLELATSLFSVSAGS